MSNDVRWGGNWGLWAARLLGAIILIVGIVIAIGGAWLAALGGSLYYLPAGGALILSGYLIAGRRLMGVWISLSLYAVTNVWALWESGAGPCAGTVIRRTAIPPVVAGTNRRRGGSRRHFPAGRLCRDELRGP